MVLVLVTAMILAAQPGSAAAAQPNSEKLADIARYPEANDVQGLRDFLYRYPELMEGNTTLANLLRRFMVESLAADQFFRFEPDLSDGVNQVQTRSLSDNSYSPPQSGPSAY